MTDTPYTPDDSKRWRQLNTLLQEAEELLAVPLRGLCPGATILLAACIAFLIAAFWGPFGWTDLGIALVCLAAAAQLERFSRREWARDQRELEEVAERIRAEMRRCADGD